MHIVQGLIIADPWIGYILAGTIPIGHRSKSGNDPLGYSLPPASRLCRRSGRPVSPCWVRPRCSRSRPWSKTRDSTGAMRSAMKATGNGRGSLRTTFGSTRFGGLTHRS
jgi:hypothetical protein